MPWPKTGLTHYHAQLGLSDKDHGNKGLVFYYVVWLGSMIYGMGLVPCCCQDGYQAQVRQHPIDDTLHTDTIQYKIQL